MNKCLKFEIVAVLLFLLIVIAGALTVKNVSSAIKYQKKYAQEINSARIVKQNVVLPLSNAQVKSMIKGCFMKVPLNIEIIKGKPNIYSLYLRTKSNAYTNILSGLRCLKDSFIVHFNHLCMGEGCGRHFLDAKVVLEVNPKSNIAYKKIR